MLKRYTRRLAQGTRGPWYRASDYSIVEPGDWLTSIKPTPGADFVEIDLWQEYYRAAKKGERRSGVVDRPYSTFLQLGARVRAEMSRMEERKLLDPISDAATEIVTRWVSEYGLIGHLPATMDFCILPTRGKAPARVVRPKSGDALSWHIHQSLNVDHDLKSFLTKKGVIVNSWSNHLTIKTPAWDFRLFFPGRDPVTDESCWTTDFKSAYGEPTYIIAATAWEFYRKSLALSTPGQSDADAALDYFTSFAHHADPRFRADAGRITYEHSSPALISSYALMLLWDAMEGLSVRDCDSCGLPFVRNSPRVHLCSDRCRWREKTRTYREKKRAKRI